MTSVAVAADLASGKHAPVAPVAPAFTWTGFHAGLNAGGGWARKSDARLLVSGVPFVSGDAGAGAFAAARKKNEPGFTGGFQAGYNHQIGQFVLGAELDYNDATVRSQPSLAAALASGVGGLAEVYGAAGELRARLNSYGTLRARAGYAVTPRFLAYVTGGLAVGDLKIRNALAAAHGVIDGDALIAGYAGAFAGGKGKARWGWTLGAGGEYAIDSNWSLKAEYLYLDLGAKNLALATTPVDGFNASARHKSQYHIFRAGVNYRF